jgi:RHS repeat-associated protein
VTEAVFVYDAVDNRTTECSASQIEGHGCGSAVRQGFTGKERDGETNLDYFGARYFSGAQGRFASTGSPSHSNPRNPRRWSLCAYVQNNPLWFSDPTGHKLPPGVPLLGVIEAVEAENERE